MIRILLILAAASVILAGCANVDVYTEKKERVDQDLAGNEGYLAGEKPAGEGQEIKKERTMINIDIGIVGGKGPAEDSSGEAALAVEEKEETVTLKDGTEVEKENVEEYIK